MKESDIVRTILKYLKTVPNCFSWKEHGGMYGTAGIPDIIACIGGQFYAFEVKKPTPAKLRHCRMSLSAKSSPAAEKPMLSAVWKR